MENISVYSLFTSIFIKSKQMKMMHVNRLHFLKCWLFKRNDPFWCILAGFILHCLTALY